MRNLTRDKAITLRMTQEEFDFFRSQLDRAKPKNQTDFFLSVLRKKPIIVVENLHAILQELKRQGNNLNQIARALNERSHFGEDATNVMNECWKTYRTISAIETEIQKVVKDALIQRKGEQGETAKGD
ncbi:MAG: MobC family plasmid mobilization relaxosome protein [Defluviitaleaceae bacterium]|nr:MobC family plasmid mobilization relaxosome protein [Defluviitaleaceae bacterium]